jgi:K+-transporting ATPase KdpF subunit
MAAWPVFSVGAILFLAIEALLVARDRRGGLSMSGLVWLGGLLALGLAGYLVLALVKPEWF